MKAWWPFANPVDEFGETGMGSEGLDRREVAGQLGFGQRGVDFVVADLMQQDSRATLATAEARDQMVQALTGAWRDWPLAQGADRVMCHAG